MVVYVDDYRVRATVGTVTANWSHLLADTETELVAFAQRIGLRPEWIQKAGQPDAHFDVTDRVRDRALRCQAKPITWRESGAIISQRRAAAQAAATAPAPPAAAPPPPAAGPSRRRPPRYNPTLQRHSWQQDAIHIYSCSFCGLRRTNHEGERGRWWQSWTWPDGQTGHNQLSGEPVPKCPGPPELN